MQSRVRTAASDSLMDPGSFHLLLRYPLLFGFASLCCFMVTRWLPQPYTSCPHSRDLCHKETKRATKTREGVSHCNNLVFYQCVGDLGGAFPVLSQQITRPPLAAKEAGKRPTSTDTTGLNPLPKLKIGGFVSKDGVLWWWCRHQ